MLDFKLYSSILPDYHAFLEIPTIILNVGNGNMKQHHIFVFWFSVHK